MESNASRFITNTQRSNSFHTFYTASGKHLQDTNIFMNRIVKYIEEHSGIVFDELVGDFVK